MYLVESTNNQDISALITEETQRVTDLLADGTLTHCWLKADFSGAVLVLDCATEEDAKAVLGTFPTAMHGATEFELTAIAEMGAAG